MKITDTIRYAGVNDHQVDLFEGQYKVPNGMSYNSYVILDDKIAVTRWPNRSQRRSGSWPAARRELRSDQSVPAAP